MLLIRYCYAGALGNIDLGPIVGPSFRVENSPSARRVDPEGSLVPVAFRHDVCLMSRSLSLHIICYCLIITKKTKQKSQYVPPPVNNSTTKKVLTQGPAALRSHVFRTIE